MKLKTIFLLATISVFLISCEGPAGIDGNANVKVYVYNSLNWSSSNNVRLTSGSCDGITSNIINSGAVLSYFSRTIQGDEIITQLPYTFLAESYTENVYMAHTLGEWALFNTSSDGIPTRYLGITNVKIVVIEGLAGKKEGIELNYTWEELVQRYPNMEYINVN